MRGGPTVNGLPGGQLRGRQRERGVLERFLAAARGGDGGVLVVYGEPGVGKTALIEDGVESAQGFRVARALGVEAEMELPFAALQQMCASLLEFSERLPQPQRDALGVAFGLSAGPAASPFFVGLAVLGLLSEAAEKRPLLCVVDDAQWLDRASARALTFVARRLLAERVALVFATRELGEALAGFPELHVEPLGRRDARALLEAVLPAPLDDRVLERIVAETRGNPLALLELPRGLSPAQLAGGFGLPAAEPLSVGIEETFARRLARLPEDARRLLLLAAADPTGDPTLLWRAAERLGIPQAAAETVQSEGLLALTPRVVFRHPLVRSAVYGAAEPNRRREVHQALADATDPEVDPDRRAWHRARAASVADADVAAELERSAVRAQARGGFAAAGAFLQRASALTLDPALRAGRALAAAEANEQAGALDAALALAETAQTGPLDEFQRAQVDVLRARISFAADRGSDAPPLLLAAAERLEPLDGGLACEIYLDALTAAMFAGRLGGAADARRIAAAARGVPGPAQPRPADLLLRGLAVLIADGHAAGTPVLREALTAFCGDDISDEEGLRWLWLAGRAAAYIWDYDRWDALIARQIRLSRESGALAVLPLTLSTRGGVELFAGNLAGAGSLVQESESVTAATDGRSVPYAPLALAAFRGREPDASQLIATTTEDFIARGEGMGVTLAQWAGAMLHNGLARYEDALAAAERGAEDPRELWYSTWMMVELVEAAARSGQPERAVDALGVLTESTRASGTPWALGVHARSNALLSDDDTAEPLYREAIDRLQPTRLRHPDLALAHAAAELNEGRPEEAAAQLALAESHVQSAPPARRHRLAVAIASLQLALARRSGQFSEVIEQVNLLDASISDESSDQITMGTELRGVALLNLGIVETWSGRLADADRHLSEGAALAQAIGRPYLEVACRAHQGFPSKLVSVGTARERGRRAVALAERHGLDDRPILAPALGAVAGMAIWMGEFDEGERWLRRAWEVASEHVEPAAAVLLHVATGMLNAGRGQHQPALEAFAAASQAQSLLTGVHALAPRIAGWLAATQARLGRPDEARATLAGVTVGPERVGVIENARAVICMADGDPAGAVDVLRDVRAITPPVDTFTLVEAHLLAGTALLHLGDRNAAAAAAEEALAAAEPDRLMFPFAMTACTQVLDALPGHATAHGALLADILDLLGGSAPASTERERSSSQIEDLSPSELRVLRYLPTNLTRPEIARELYVSINTVNTHIRNIYSKLGARDRSAAVARAREFRLLSSGRS